MQLFFEYITKINVHVADDSFALCTTNGKLESSSCYLAHLVKTASYISRKGSPEMNGKVFSIVYLRLSEWNVCNFVLNKQRPVRITS